MFKICYVSTLPITIKSFFLRELSYMREQGAVVTVICGYDPELNDVLSDKGIEFVPLDIPRGMDFGGTVRSTRKLVRIFKSCQYDMIQYCTPNASLCASIAGRLSGIRIRNYHMMGIRYLSENGWKKRMLKKAEKLTCHLSSDVEVVSKSNLELALSEGLFSSRKGIVIWNGSSGGVDLDRFDHSKKDTWRNRIRENLGLSDQTILYGFVGRLNREKGIEDLVTAFKNLDETSQDKAALLLVGEKENPEQVSSWVWEYIDERDNIFLEGHQRDIEEYFAAIDVLVFPSHREGFGNVLIEAQAMGVPVVSYEIPGPIDAMVDNVTGLFVKPYDTEDLFDKMFQLIDKEYRKVLSQNSRAYIEKHFDANILVEHVWKRKIELLRKYGRKLTDNKH